MEVYHKISIPAQKVDEPKSFKLPGVNNYGNTVTSYLQKRGINADIINKCIGAGLLGMTKIREAIRADPIISQRVKLIVDNPPAVGTGKDYNEFLQKKIAVSSLEKVKNKGIEK